jgi:hypothetical protein
VGCQGGYDVQRPVGGAPLGVRVLARTADRKARLSVAKSDVDPSTQRGRLSYRRAPELFEAHTDHYNNGPYTLHQLRHSRLTHAAEDVLADESRQLLREWGVS